MSVPDKNQLHIPHKFFSARLALELDKFVSNPEARLGFREVLRRQDVFERTNYLEIERWAERIPLGGGGQAPFDAIVDPALSADNPADSEFTSIVPAVDHVLGSKDHAYIGVIHRAGVSVTDTTTSSNFSSGKSVSIIGLTSFVEHQHVSAPNQNRRIVWDAQVVPFPAGFGRAFVQGMVLRNTGVNRGSFFGAGGGSSVQIYRCDAFGREGSSTTQHFSEIGGVTTFIEECFLFGIRVHHGTCRNSMVTWWDNFDITTGQGGTELVDFIGCTFSGRNDGKVEFSGGGYQLFSGCRFTGLHWTGSGGRLIDLEFNNGNIVMVGCTGKDSNLQTGFQAVDLIINSGVIACEVVGGEWGQLTVAAHAANRPRHIVAFVAAGTVNGPAVINLQTKGDTPDEIIISGSHVVGSLDVGPDTFGFKTAIIFSGATDCCITATVENVSGDTDSLQPYSFNASSARNILVIGGSRTGWPIAGADSGTDNLIIDERGAPPQAHVSTHEGGSDALTGNHPARALLGLFIQDDVAASQTDVALNLYASTTRSTHIPVRSGDLTGIVVRSNEARTAGTLTVEATINGVKTGLSATLDATNTTFHAVTQALGLDTFVAGDELGVVLTTDASWAPTTADISVELETVS